MNKLQLYIAKSYDGYKILFSINPSEEVRHHVHELRHLVEKVKYDASEKNIFYYVTTTATGTFVTIIRTIPTAPVDHLAAWIFIPNEVIIDGEMLERVVKTTTRKVSGEKVTTDDVASLRELFSTEYMTDPEAPAMTASKKGGDIAWRRYNGDTGVTLSALFGVGLFQLPYLDFAGVVFVDGDLGLEVRGHDITGMHINGPAVILPAPKTPENFTAHVFGRPLDCPVRATRDAKVDVVWKHAGFEDVVRHEVIDSAEFLPAMPDTSHSRKAVTMSSFQIMAQSARVPLEDCTITVNGDRISDEPRMYTTAQLNPAMVTIHCEGYAPYSAKMDLASSTKALVRLQERTKVYCFEMPVKHADLGAPVRFKLYSKKAVDGSPLEGYTAVDTVLEGETRTNHLTYTGTAPSLQSKGIYVGIGLVVGLILGWITACGGGAKADTVEDPEPKQEGLEVVDMVIDKSAQAATAVPQAQPEAEKPKAETPAPAADVPVNKVQVTAAAISYLDNNNTWTKAELEKYPELKGLFDDMNNFRLEKLSDDWGTKLKDSKKFTNLATHAKYGLNPKKLAKSKIEGTTFLTGGDEKITYVTYLNRIDP